MAKSINENKLKAQRKIEESVKAAAA